MFPSPHSVWARAEQLKIEINEAGPLSLTSWPKRLPLRLLGNLAPPNSVKSAARGLRGLVYAENLHGHITSRRGVKTPRRQEPTPLDPGTNSAPAQAAAAPGGGLTPGAGARVYAEELKQGFQQRRSPRLPHHPSIRGQFPTLPPRLQRETNRRRGLESCC